MVYLVPEFLKRLKANVLIDFSFILSKEETSYLVRDNFVATKSKGDISLSL